MSISQKRYPPKAVTRVAIRVLQRSPQRISVSNRFRRRWLDRAARLAPLPEGTVVSAERLGGVPGARFELGPADRTRAVLYLHGGSFCAGSLVTHRGLTSRLAGEAGVPVHALDYRLAPEHPYPAALDDAEAAYSGLLEQGLDPSRIVVAGDSAGGWLTLALAVRLRDRGAALPAGLALICPFLDMTLAGETLETNRKHDAGLRPDWVRATRPWFFADPGLDPEEMTAARGDLTGLPPIHLQAASDDVLRSDAELLRDRAAEQGAELEYRRWEQVWHDFQATAGSLTEADEAVEALGGFARRVTGAAEAKPRRPRVAIVGAGFGGIGMAITLKRAGFEDLTILDRGDRPGGVWRDNTYPGAACDVPSHLYAFSFEPNPDWSRRYSPQSEILAYLERCVDRNGLRPHLRLGVEVESAAYDEGRGEWRLRTAEGETIEADVLVSACGQLSRPKIPPIDGLERFEGPIFHSSRWDHGVELAGKRVAVIGTGASTIQILPAIAGRAGHIDLYQRSAPFVVPKKDRPYRGWERRLFRFAPFRKLQRFWFWLVFEIFIAAFNQFPPLGRLGTRVFSRQLEEQIPDPELRAAVTPDHVIGCKRVLISSDYYSALAREDVDLVPAAVRELKAASVVAEDGTEREADVVVLSTGFETTRFLAPMAVRGSGGVDLNEAWRDGAEAYLGMTVAGFPNLFLMYGPNTNLGSGSIIYQLESQMAYIADAVAALERSGARSVSVRPEVQGEFAREMQERLSTSVWMTGCNSWYVDENGRNTNNWPGFTVEYRRRTRRLDPDDYLLSG